MLKVPRIATLLMSRSRRTPGYGGMVDVYNRKGGFTRIDTTPDYAKQDTTPRVPGMPIRTR